MKKSILIVDDDESTLRTLSFVFKKRGYQVDTAETGQDALEKAKGKFFNLALLDLKLPDMEGAELLTPLKQMHPDMVLLMVTAYASLETALKALHNGASAYITKPLNLDAVMATVSEALEKQRLVAENRSLYQEAQRELAERKRAEEESRRYSEKLQDLIENITKAIALTTEMRDPYTSGHQQRVTQLAYAISEEMGLDKEIVAGIRVAGSLHDIGKMYIPGEILTKPGKLTEIELDMIRTHPEAGYSIVKTIEFPWPVAQIVLQHHERMDGSGYPAGLSAKDILLEAKILGVADVVEAMASHRPYRPALGIDKALEEISQKKGVLYDPEVVDTCLKLFAEKKFKFQKETPWQYQAVVRNKHTIVTSKLRGIEAN